MSDMFFVLIPMLALIFECLCMFLIVFLLARIAWRLSKYLLDSAKPLQILNKNLSSTVKEKYEIKIAYLENAPIWVYVTLHFSRDEWFLLKNSEEFKQVVITDICETNSSKKSVTVTFGLSFNHWCMVESSAIFKAILDKKIHYRDITGYSEC